MAEAINDKEIEKMIIDDLIEHRNFSKEKAKEWLRINGSIVVEKMWDAYTSEIENVEMEDEDE